MPAVRNVLSELRYPTTLWARLLAGVLSIVFFGFLLLTAVVGFCLYHVLMPQNTSENINPARLIGHITPTAFATADGLRRVGWFLPGAKGAPVIVLCHGYGSNRGSALALATSLQEHRYNVFLFNFSGHGDSPGRYTTLGFGEVEELVGAMRMLLTRDDVDPERAAIWGLSMGGYVALEAAGKIPQVKFVIADSIYASPFDLMAYQIDQIGPGTLPLVKPYAMLLFKLLNFRYRARPPLTHDPSRLRAVTKLFIEGNDSPEFFRMTRAIYDVAPEPKQEWVLPRTNYPTLMDEEKREYERRLTVFFLQNLPVIRRAR
ncbi:MAG TPA: alpha/beta hydrolase [Candidatus Acidoferrales bacterium]